MRIVEVVWDDAHATLDGISVASAQNGKPARTHSAGFLVAENEDGITIATDTYPAEADQVGAPHFIPWEVVIAVYEFV